MSEEEEMMDIPCEDAMVRAPEVNEFNLNNMMLESVVRPRVIKSARQVLEQAEAKKIERKQEKIAIREKVEQAMKAEMRHIGKNVVIPEYKFDSKLKIFRENNVPPKEFFLPLGFNPDHQSVDKHYRKYYEDELEEVPGLFKSPFKKCPIIRGQQRGLSKSWFKKDKLDEQGQVSTVKEVGEFKGVVTVTNIGESDLFIAQRQSRILILKHSIDELSLRMTGKKFDYDYNELMTSEGR